MALVELGHAMHDDEFRELFHSLELHLERIDGRIDRLDTRIDGTEKRLETKIDGLSDRLDVKIDGLGNRLDTKIDAMGKRLDARIDSVEKAITDVRSEVRTRFEGIENRLNTKAGNWVVSLWGSTLAILIGAAFALTRWW